MQTSLKGKIAFITGASSGIGEATAIRFAKQGANLILCARSKEKLENLKSELIKNYGIECLALELDVTDKEKVFSTVNNLPAKWQEIDILFNNAGLALGLETFTEADLSDYDTMIATNINGFIYVAKAVVPLMVKRGKPADIINMGSSAGDQAYAKGSVYCASKAFVKSFTDSLRIELMDTPIRVCNIKPGMVETNFSVTRFKGDEARAHSVYQNIEPLTGDDIARVIETIVTYPANITIPELQVFPVNQVLGITPTKK